MKTISLIRVGNIRKHAKDENIVKLKLKCGTPRCGSYDFYEIKRTQQIEAISQETIAELNQRLYICTNCRSLFYKVETLGDPIEEEVI